ncbi:hypothetical protein [Burkholderia pyrrocinia]|uniref:hypothetical protein n=1 Tax=Burkholderia pyrrocinia TaxID=60550 RepID=UPI002AB2B11B|nr:hypothetical protein [Burkholderia pyrrocinia]
MNTDTLPLLMSKLKEGAPTWSATSVIAKDMWNIFGHFLLQLNQPVSRGAHPDRRIHSAITKRVAQSKTKLANFCSSQAHAPSNCLPDELRSDSGAPRIPDFASLPDDIVAALGFTSVPRVY